MLQLLARLRSAIALSALALLCTACARPAPTGLVRVLASTAEVAIAEVTVHLLDAQLAVVAQHDLALSDGAWQLTLSDIPVGTYTFEADAFASGSATRSFHGSAPNISIAAGQMALVEIVMVSDSAPASVTAPSITSVTASTATPREGQQVALEATGNEPGLTFGWSASGGAFTTAGGPMSASGASVTWYAPASDGAQTLTVSATDGSGDSASLTFTLAVVPLQGSASVSVFLPPQITSLSATQVPGAPLEWLLHLATAEPPDNAALTYLWTHSGGACAGSFSADTSAQPSFTFAPTSGTCTLQVTVTDPNPAILAPPYPSVTANLTLAAGALTVVFPPTITLGSQSLLNAKGCEVVYFDLSAVDANSPPLPLTYSWAATDGAPLASTPSAAVTSFDWTAPATIAPAGSIITATVSNGLASATQLFTVDAAPGSDCAP